MLIYSVYLQISNNIILFTTFFIIDRLTLFTTVYILCISWSTPLFYNTDCDNILAILTLLNKDIL